MNMVRRTSLSLLLSLVCACAVPPAPAQQEENPHAAETTAQVPALSKFHTPIYKLWHTAWPKKDTAMMAMLTPDIEKGIADVAQAELPGILRDKKAVWEENVKVLQTIGVQYREAMAGKDLAAKMQAAEKLHAQYEKLVRIVRPVMKQIEAFHSVLYMLYHYYMPENDLDKIRSSGKDLRTRMDSLNAATLPERLKKKEEAFVAARAALSASVDAVNAAVSTNDGKKIKDAIIAMHGDYEKLEKVFE
jgi:hypothetical protein